MKNSKAPMKKQDSELRIADDLAKQLIAMGHSETSSSTDGKEWKETKVTITGEGDSMEVSYSLTRAEVRRLQILAEVTGLPMKWHTTDVFHWVRSYIDNLSPIGDGNLGDLIDVRNKEHVAPVPRSHHIRTRLFMERMDEEMERHNGENKAVKTLLAKSERARAEQEKWQTSVKRSKMKELVCQVSEKFLQLARKRYRLKPEVIADALVYDFTLRPPSELKLVKDKRPALKAA